MGASFRVLERGRARGGRGGGEGVFACTCTVRYWHIFMTAIENASCASSANRLPRVCGLPVPTRVLSLMFDLPLRPRVTLVKTIAPFYLCINEISVKRLSSFPSSFADFFRVGSLYLVCACFPSGAPVRLVVQSVVDAARSEKLAFVLRGVFL